MAFAYPITSATEVKSLVDGLRALHHSARHHCYAYRIGMQGDEFRASDDGEPAGTAARPILGQILSRELSDVLVVVVRYFGGTLLGVPGLIAAYKAATAEVLDAAQVVEKKVCDSFVVEFDYPRMNSVLRVVRSAGADVVQMGNSGANCLLTISIGRSQGEALCAELNELRVEKIKLI